jgi:hypothetical protein
MSEYQPGLEGVPATKSKISYLDGKQGILTYRGYPIVERSRKRPICCWTASCRQPISWSVLTPSCAGTGRSSTIFGTSCAHCR